MMFSTSTTASSTSSPIAIGELVDDAVVDVENIMRRLRENRRKRAPLPVTEVIGAACEEVRSGVLYATVVIVLVLLPLFAMSGLEGRLFSPLGVAYVVSILGSLLVSITVTPVLSYYLLTGRREPHRESLLLRQLQLANAAALSWA